MLPRNTGPWGSTYAPVLAFSTSLERVVPTMRARSSGVISKVWTIPRERPEAGACARAPRRWRRAAHDECELVQRRSSGDRRQTRVDAHCSPRGRLDVGYVVGRIFIRSFPDFRGDIDELGFGVDERRSSMGIVRRYLVAAGTSERKNCGFLKSSPPTSRQARSPLQYFAPGLRRVC